MRIVQLTPGSGGSFYCENCLRDGAMIPAMRKLGHDALMVPLYLPPLEDQPGRAPAAPIFFGGINVYLQQKLSLFRKTPRWVDWLFDRPRLLRWAGRRVGMTAAGELGETTLSMLRGEDGRQVKELDRLVAWIGKQERPDVVCLSNALLIGLARRIKAALNVPVVCLLQDEDGFLDALPQPQRRLAWQAIRQRASDIDAFVGVSRYYAEEMKRRLGLAEGRVHAVHAGFDPSGYEPAAALPEQPVIGYLSHMTRSKGLDTLVEAFSILKTQEQFKALKLRVAGGKTGADEPFLAEIRGQLARLGLAEDVEFVGDFDRPSRIAFLRSLSVLSVPTRRPEAFGLFVLEALACGVPVVQPRHGSFPELIEATGGGLLCEPNDPGALAGELERLLRDRDLARELGQRGRQAVLKDFNIDTAARKFLGICEQVAGAPGAGCAQD